MQPEEWEDGKCETETECVVSNMLNEKRNDDYYKPQIISGKTGKKKTHSGKQSGKLSAATF